MPDTRSQYQNSGISYFLLFLLQRRQANLMLVCKYWRELLLSVQAERGWSVSTLATMRKSDKLAKPIRDLTVFFLPPNASFHALLANKSLTDHLTNMGANSTAAQDCFRFLCQRAVISLAASGYFTYGWLLENYLALSPNLLAYLNTEEGQFYWDNARKVYTDSKIIQMIRTTQELRALSSSRLALLYDQGWLNHHDDIRIVDTNENLALANIARKFSEAISSTLSRWGTLAIGLDKIFHRYEQIVLDCKSFNELRFQLAYIFYSVRENFPPAQQRNYQQIKNNILSGFAQFERWLRLQTLSSQPIINLLTSPTSQIYNLLEAPIYFTLSYSEEKMQTSILTRILQRACIHFKNWIECGRIGGGYFAAYNHPQLHAIEFGEFALSLFNFTDLASLTLSLRCFLSEHRDHFNHSPISFILNELKDYPGFQNILDITLQPFTDYTTNAGANTRKMMLNKLIDSIPMTSIDLTP